VTDLEHLRVLAREASRGDAPPLAVAHALLDAVAEIDQLREVVRGLAETRPINGGYDSPHCVLCGAEPGWPEGDVRLDRDPATHADDCPWAAARRLMEE